MSEKPRYGLANAHSKASVRPCPRGHGNVKETAVCNYNRNGHAVYRQPGTKILPVHIEGLPERDSTLRESDSFSSQTGFRSIILIRLNLEDYGQSTAYYKLQRFVRLNNLGCAAVKDQPALFTLWRLTPATLDDLAKRQWCLEIDEHQRGLSGAGDVRHVARKPPQKPSARVDQLREPRRSTIQALRGTVNKLALHGESWRGTL